MVIGQQDQGSRADGGLVGHRPGRRSDGFDARYDDEPRPAPPVPTVEARSERHDPGRRPGRQYRQHRPDDRRTVVPGHTELPDRREIDRDRLARATGSGTGHRVLDDRTRVSRIGDVADTDRHPPPTNGARASIRASVVAPAHLQHADTDPDQRPVAQRRRRHERFAVDEHAGSPRDLYGDDVAAGVDDEVVRLDRRIVDDRTTRSPTDRAASRGKPDHAAGIRTAHHDQLPHRRHDGVGGPRGPKRNRSAAAILIRP